MRSMFLINETDAMVVSGCDTRFERDKISGKSSFTIQGGIVYYKKKLWRFRGGVISGSVRFPSAYSQSYCLMFDEVDASPSPVYGPTLVLDQRPHKELVSVLMEVSDMGDNDNWCALGSLKRVPRIGVGESVTEMTLSGSAESPKYN